MYGYILIYYVSISIIYTVCFTVIDTYKWYFFFNQLNYGFTFFYLFSYRTTLVTKPTFLVNNKKLGAVNHLLFRFSLLFWEYIFELKF